MSLTSYRAAPPRVRRRWRSATPIAYRRRGRLSVLCRPGDDLLSHVLRQSTIGAKAFDGRVRDGIGSYHLAKATRPAKNGEAKLAFHVFRFKVSALKSLAPWRREQSSRTSD